MNAHIAIATVGDSRDDFFALREPLIHEELAKLDWLRNATDFVESGILRSSNSIGEFYNHVSPTNPEALVIFIPVWGDPILSVKLWNYFQLPVCLLGNSRPDTSSMVGILGAGGALDQVGCDHLRFFDPGDLQTQEKVIAFVTAASAVRRLRGQTLGLFGGRSLGISTTTADPAQWQRLFGVDILPLEQAEIINLAENLPDQIVRQHASWLLEKVGEVDYRGSFSELSVERQARSYLATIELVKRYHLDFVGVKCQPELSDGYVSQCVAHMLMNGDLDANGYKDTIVHACEADADGALSMQILHLISGGMPTALLDIRWYDAENQTWTLANCGAMAANFYQIPGSKDGLSQVSYVPHVFGAGGGGALPAPVAEQNVTLARLCRKDGEYWMAILAGETQVMKIEDLAGTTYAFPQARLKTAADERFIETFGSNHIHMVAGDYVDTLINFCNLVDVAYKVW